MEPAPMSVMQKAGVDVQRGFYALVLMAIMMLCLFTLWVSADYAAGMVDGILASFGALLFVSGLEAIRMYSPVAAYNLRYDHPIMARIWLCSFIVLQVLSLVMTIGWAVSVEPAPYSNLAELERIYAGQSPAFWTLLVLIAQFFSAAGPVGWIASTKGADEQHHLPRHVLYPDVTYEQHPQLAAPEHAPQALPYGGEAMPALSFMDAFATWVPENIDYPPGAHVDFASALRSYNQWASSRAYPLADPVEFERVMAMLAGQYHGWVADGVIYGIALKDDANAYLNVG